MMQPYFKRFEFDSPDYPENLKIIYLTFRIILIKRLIESETVKKWEVRFPTDGRNYTNFKYNSKQGQSDSNTQLCGRARVNWYNVPPL
jgi:hypothetical protein